MADSYQQGYDERRFADPVREDLFCSICQCVLRDPRTCQNEHPFCLSCISQHLHNSHTCPECREHLTPETLKTPRFLKNILSELKIKCEFIERGCPGYVLLGNLQNHTEKCGFAPTMCANEECGVVLNKKDKDIHEKELCPFRIAKCHDCKNIKKNVDEMKAAQNENQDEMKLTQSQLKANQVEIKASQDNMKGELNATKVEVVKMERKQDEINVKVNRMKENIDEIKQTQAEIKADQEMFKAEVREQFKTVTDMLNELLQGRNENHNGAQAMNPSVPDNNQDIIILGGRCGPTVDDVSNTVEKFNVAEGKSTELPRMDKPRTGSASCVYNNDLIVTGGYDSQNGHDSIEVLGMDQYPLEWKMFQRKLPFKLYSHAVTVYQDTMYAIGGYNGGANKTSDAIHKLALTPPYTTKLLVRMPQARRNHSAEIVNGKLFILGGTTANNNKVAIDSVVAYNFITNKFETCPSLPKAVCKMSTVTWGNTIIVVGGQDKNEQDLNDVIMYDAETGRSERLPSLKHKRRGHSAVIIDDVIVVLGGCNEEQEYLNSVESFTMGSDGWKELPGMKEKRGWATAVAKPGGNLC